MADRDDRLAAPGDGVPQGLCVGARREPGVGLRAELGRFRDPLGGLAGAEQRARDDGVERAAVASCSPSARAVGAAGRGQRAQLVGIAGRRLGVAYQEDAHGP